LDTYVDPGRQIALVYKSGEATYKEYLFAIAARYAPNDLMLVGEDIDHDKIAAPLLKDRVSVEGKPTVYLCEGFTCKAPINNLEALRATLGT